MAATKTTLELFNSDTPAAGSWVTLPRGNYRLLSDVPTSDAGSVTFEERMLTTGTAHPIQVGGVDLTHIDGSPGHNFTAYQGCQVRATMAAGTATTLVQALLLID